MYMQRSAPLTSYLKITTLKLFVKNLMFNSYTVEVKSE